MISLTLNAIIGLVAGAGMILGFILGWVFGRSRNPKDIEDAQEIVDEVEEELNNRQDPEEIIKNIKVEPVVTN